ncbi:MAG: GNAT family N-acetyltransferase [Dermatophilaceae bacterium]
MNEIREITVRSLTEADWADYRAVRLAALTDSPEAFSSTAEEEQAWTEEQWLARMRRAPRFIAERAGQVVGTAALGLHAATDVDGQDIDAGPDAAVGEIFGLWVTPLARGTGVATALASAASKRALNDGRSHVVYWVSTDNGRAVAFASGLGFRPTDSRRAMRGSRHEGEEEIAMILPLGSDRGTRPTLG